MSGKQTTVENHPSYGIIDIARTSSNGNHTLFGSSIKHRNFITLKLKKASKRRDLNRTWYYGEDTVIEVDMSATQFVDALTNMNTSGVPCTIRRINGETTPPCPDENVRDKFVQEFNQDLQNIIGGVVKAITALQQTLDQRVVKKSTVNEALESLAKVKQDLTKNLPFVANQFNKQMDQSVSEALGEMDAFFSNMIHSLGSEILVKRLEDGTLNHHILLDATHGVEDDNID